MRGRGESVCAAVAFVPSPTHQREWKAEVRYARERGVCARGRCLCPLSHAPTRVEGRGSVCAGEGSLRAWLAHYRRRTASLHRRGRGAVVYNGVGVGLLSAPTLVRTTMRDPLSGGLPPMFAAVAEHLKSVAAPPEDDGEAWAATYAMLQVLRQPGAGPWHAGSVGTVKLRRSANRAGSFDLHADVLHALGHGLRDRYAADITSRADAAGSLISWRRESCFEAIQPGLNSTPRRADTGKVSGGHLVRRPGTHSRERFDRRQPLVAQWALFDTVRRIKGPLDFAMLEEMDAVRLNQTARPMPMEPIEVATASGPLRLRCVLQTGDGILPITWWLAPSGLPLMVLASCRAFVLSPGAAMPEMPS